MAWNEKTVSDHTQQNSDEWLEWRRKGIGASDLPIIMEAVDWKTPYQLFEEKLGIADHSSGNDFIQKKGHALEPIARDRYKILTGRHIGPQVFEHLTDTWKRASLDGWNEVEKGVVEIKFTGKEMHSLTALQSIIPPQYLPQVYWQTHVTNAKWLDYASYYVAPEDDYEMGNLAVVRLEIDQEYMDEVVKAGTDFWKLVQTKKAPKLTKNDVVKIEDEKAIELVKLYIEADKSMKQFEVVKDTVKAELIKFAKIHPKTSIANLKITRSLSKGRVDYKRVPMIKGINLDDYRGPDSASYKLTVGKNE